MAHHNQRQVRDQRQKRRNAFLCIFLFIPLILAGVFLFRIYNKELNADTVTEIQLVYNEKTYTLTDKGAITRCMNAVRHAIKITLHEHSFDHYKKVAFSCTDSFTQELCTLYLSDDAADCLVIDRDGKTHSISEADAMALLCAEEFSFLYTTAPLPLDIKIGDKTHTLSASYEWNYLLPNEETRTTSATEEKETTLVAEGTLPEFSVQGNPDEVTLSVLYPDGTGEHGKPIPELPDLLPAAGGEVQVSVSATWDDAQTDGYWGTAKYNFTLIYLPA